MDTAITLSDPLTGAAYSISLTLSIDNADVHEVVIAELKLISVKLRGEGLNVFNGYFPKNDTTLTKVTLHYCDFGEEEDA
jgi:hypothetical protein